MARILLVLSLLSLLSACDVYNLDDTDEVDPIDCSTIDVFSDQPDFDNPGTVVGRVSSPSGEVFVGGARVEIEVGSEVAWALSGAFGCFQLQLPAGSHTVEIDKGRYQAATSFDVTTDDITDLGIVPLDEGDAELAVVFGRYDDVGALIDELGVPHDDFASPGDLFADAGKLAVYDVVFSNCGSDATTTNDGFYPIQHLDNVREWVEAGGTLYVSDWEWALYEGVAPEALNFGEDPLYGVPGVVQATVLDRDLVALLGRDTADISFDLLDWAVIESVEEAYPLVMASLPGDTEPHPLAAIHFKGDGRMIYTSFHNEQQVTADMRLILFELILSL